MPTVTFSDVADLKARGLAAFEDERRRLLSWAPGVQVELVGSLSFAQGLSRGDLDIQIRVAPAGYAAALAAIAPRYAVNPDGYTSDDAASFKDDERDPPVGIIITASDGSGDVLWRFRDALRARPDLAAAYSELKARFQGGELSAYRAEKHAFIRRVRRTPEYVELSRSLPWRFRPVRIVGPRAVVFDAQDVDAPRFAAFCTLDPAAAAERRTASGWVGELSRRAAAMTRGEALHAFWVDREEEDGAIRGLADLTGIGAGAAALSLDLAGRAPDEQAHEAVEGLVACARTELGLRRLGAACDLDDRRAVLLRRLGFEPDADAGGLGAARAWRWAAGAGG